MANGKRRNCRLQGMTILLLQRDRYALQKPAYLRLFGASGLIYPCAVPAAFHCPARRIISDATRATMEIIARNIQSAMMAAVRGETLDARFTALRVKMEIIARNIPAMIAHSRGEILHARFTVICVVMVIIAMIIPALIALRGDILHVLLTVICANLLRISALIMAAEAAPAVIAPAPETTNVLS